MSTADAMADNRPCWHCQYWGGWAWGGPHSWCRRPEGGGVIAQPEQGCAHWIREPGSDDEDRAPARAE